VPRLFCKIKDNQSLDYPVSCKTVTDKYTGVVMAKSEQLFRDDYFIVCLKRYYLQKRSNAVAMLQALQRM
jgi:hypothetical protein